MCALQPPNYCLSMKHTSFHLLCNLPVIFSFMSFFSIFRTAYWKFMESISDVKKCHPFFFAPSREYTQLAPQPANMSFSWRIGQITCGLKQIKDFGWGAPVLNGVWPCCKHEHYSRVQARKLDRMPFILENANGRILIRSSTEKGAHQYQSL